MKVFLNDSASEAVLLRSLCIFSLLLFFVAVMLVALLIRQNRWRWLLLALPLLVLSYFMEQCFDMRLSGLVYSDIAARIVNGFSSVPNWILLTVCFASAIAEVLLMRNIHLCEKNQITTMSVKEALDSLPTGILCYEPGAKILLVNRVMQDFCRKTTNAELIDSTDFDERLHNGMLVPTCNRIFVGNEPIIILPDGAAWKISVGAVSYEKHTIRMLLVSDITEVYRKTQELQQMQEKVARLEKKLQKVNREIVAMTTEREMLNAKVKIHNELGSNLLAIKRFLAKGGTEEEKAELMKSLQRNVSFLKNELPTPPIRDEYELLISMATQLGLRIIIEGELPQTEPLKRILTTAIHECFTNTLRHAHGDELHIEITTDAETLTAVFSNNGEPPAYEITEKGGLNSLRKLANQVGGHMSIRSIPAFEIRLTLPKEGEDAL